MAKYQKILLKILKIYNIRYLHEWIHLILFTFIRPFFFYDTYEIYNSLIHT